MKLQISIEEYMRALIEQKLAATPEQAHKAYCLAHTGQIGGAMDALRPGPSRVSLRREVALAICHLGWMLGEEKVKLEVPETQSIPENVTMAPGSLGANE